MIPILYDSNEAAFVSNGLCRLRDCISCVVSEERNSIYECTFQYPVTGANYDLIKCGRIIAVIHDDTDDIQPFDIVSFSRPIDGVVTFRAVHISYRQSKMTASGTNVNSLSDAFHMLKSAKPSNPFTYWTDKKSTGLFAAADGVPRSVRQMLGGSEGSILDCYGGEYEWDKWTVKLWGSRGKNLDLAIRYGLNLMNYDEEVDFSETFTSCIPYWVGGDDNAVVKGNVVKTGVASFDGREKCVPLNLTDKFQEKPTAQQLETLAAQLMDSNRVFAGTQSIKVEFTRLQDSPEYESYAELMKCSLCDSINVVFPAYDTSARFKIVKTVYDVLEERFSEMELGSLSTTLSQALGLDNNNVSVSDMKVVQAAADAQGSANMANGILAGMEAAASAAHTTLNGIYATAEDASDTLAEMKDAAEAAETTLTGIYQDAADAKTAASSAQASAATAQASATQAIADAATAKSSAGSAQASANQALANAATAQQAANNAQRDANTANKAANGALTQLSVVEDVVGVLNWIAEHGTYAKTSDTEVIPGKYYFTRSGSSPNYTYAVVVNPTGNPHTKGYYELTGTDEAVANYVSSHLALTNQGLWVINDNSSYKILLSSTGMKVYDAQGILVATFGESISFSSTRPQYIGNNNSYIVFDPTGSGSLTIGGASILMGTQTLEEVFDSYSTTEEMNSAIGSAASTAQTNAVNAVWSATNGYTILWNYSAFATANNGEGYICKLDPKTGTKSDANGTVMWNGTTRTISKQMINPNAVLPYNIPIYVVCRLSSAAATTGTNYMVWYDDGWKYASMPTPTAVGGSWTWAEATDIILGKFVETGSDTAFTECEVYDPPYSSKQVTTDTVTARSANSIATAANAAANTANTTANKALGQSTWYATCDTAAATTAKVATITPTTTAFTLSAGASVNVKFTTTNSGAVGSITLNVNGTGAKNIKYINNNAISNIPGAGYIVGGATYQFVYDGTYWVIQNLNYNTNNIDRVLHNNYVLAASAVTSGALVCGTSAGYKQIAANVAFDLTYPIFWAGGAWTSGTQYANAYESYPSVNPATTGTVQNIAKNATVYLRGKVSSGKTFTVSAAPFLTATVPTSADGYAYIPLGVIANDATTKMYFRSSQDLWAYQNGKFQKVDSVPSYITKYGSTGIHIHPEGDDANYLALDANGVDVIKNNTSVAFYGDEMRVGAERKAHLSISDASIRGVSENGYEFFEISSNGGSGTTTISRTIASELGNDSKSYDLSTIFGTEWASISTGGTFKIRTAYYSKKDGIVAFYKGQIDTYTKGTTKSHTYSSYTAPNTVATKTGYPTLPSGATFDHKKIWFTYDKTIPNLPFYRFGLDAATSGGGNSFAMGEGTTAIGDNQMAIGRWNAEDDLSPFVIGWGSSEAYRKNIFSVNQGGDVDIPAGARYRVNGVPIGAPFFTCSTAAGTAAKTATLVSGSYDYYDRQTGMQVLVKFTNANTASSPTLKLTGGDLDDTTAKPIMRYGTTTAGTSAAASWNAGAIVRFVYDGTNWIIEDWQNTTYSSMSEAEITAGTGTAARLITPARLKKAVETYVDYEKVTFTPAKGANYDYYGGCYYEKYGRVVHVHVGINGLTANTANNILTLPAGYRPASLIVVHGTGGSWNNLGYVDINTSGVIQVRTEGAACCADVTFIV